MPTQVATRWIDVDTYFYALIDCKALCNALLPKLLSREIRVKDAEGIEGGAV